MPETGSSCPAVMLREVAGSKTVPREDAAQRVGLGSLLQRHQVLQVGESAAVLGGRGNGLGVGLALHDARALVIHKEERLVTTVVEMRNDQRAAEGSAELVLPELRLALGRQNKIVLRVEVVVAQELPQVTVKRVGAGLRGQVQNRAGGMAKLGGVIVGLHGELAQRIGWRQHHEL